MKLAYVSPMPPARTGIATYSVHLIQALKNRCEVTVFTPTSNATPIAGLELVEFASDPWRLKALAQHDRILYHVGNNPWQHAEIAQVMRVFPGAACLHDLVLYFLAAGFGKGTLLKELLLEDPDAAFCSLRSIERDSTEGNLLRYRTPSRHPCLRGLLERTQHVFVHNQTSARTLAELGYAGRVDVIPLLHYPVDARARSPVDVAAVRRELGYCDSDYVFGTFGFIGPPKRINAVFDALEKLKARDAGTRAHLLIVGEGDSLEAAIRERGLESIVKMTGFVAEEQFARYLGTADAVINLRYPSHGESSATLIQAMALGKACVVTDNAFFSELPDETVIKVSHAESEVDDILGALDRLMSEAGLAARIGAAARKYIVERHAPSAAAASIVRGLAAVKSARQSPGDSRPAAPSAAFSSARYLEARAKQLLPR